MCTKWEVQIFNVRTIIVQSLFIKGWILLEFQIAQTRQPLSFSDGKTTVKMRKTFLKQSQNRRCTSSMYEQIIVQSLNIQRNEYCWSYILQKLGTP